MAKSKKKPTGRKTPKGKRSVRNAQAGDPAQVVASEPMAPNPLVGTPTLKDRIDAQLKAISKTIADIRADLRQETPTRKFDSKKTGLGTPSNHCSGDESNLSDAEQCVLEVVDADPRRGSVIAERAGYTYDAVRRHLSLLKKLGFIEHNNRGYFRV